MSSPPIPSPPLKKKRDLHSLLALDDATRNVYATLAFWLGVLSFLPLVGYVTCLPALVLGLMGLRYARQNPQAQGRTEAMIGINLGVVGVLTNYLLLYLAQHLMSGLF